MLNRRGGVGAVVLESAGQYTAHGLDPGAPIGFADRAQIEEVLQRASSSHYGVRSLIHELVQSDLFLNK
jgi:hypothetical protein